MKVAIAFITKNRPAVAAKAIEQHLKFLPEGAQLFIVDDNSEYKEGDVDIESCIPESVTYYRSPIWLGVAGARNMALSLMADTDADVFFLLDDDVFPKKEGWIDLYLDALQRSPKQHLLKAASQPWAGVEMKHRAINICQNTTATLFCMTRELLDTVGGFDETIGKYGYEDGDYYKRVAQTNLVPFGVKCVPKGMEQYLHISDLDGDFEDLIWQHRSALHDIKDDLLEDSKNSIIEKYNHATTIFIPYRRAAIVSSGERM